MLGSCSFVIRDEILDFDEISGKLALLPTSITKKGQAIRQGIDIQAPYDIWRYEVVITEWTQPEEALDSLMNILSPKFKEVNELAGIYRGLGIDCYLRSEYGQMGLQLSNEIMKKISLLGVGLDIHILSFGGVEN